MSTMYVNQIAPLQGDVISIASGTLIQPGMTLQVIQSTFTNAFSTNSTSMTDITGLSVSITPKYLTSKILVMMNVSVGGGNGADVNHVYVQLVRNSTPIHVGDSRSNRTGATNVINTAVAGQMYHANAVYLDSPSSVSQLTYKVQIKTSNASYTATVNRSGRDSDTSLYDGTAASSITVMEIAG